MRNVIVSLTAAAVLSVSLHAANYSSALSEARAVQMENYKEKEAAILERVENLIKRTSNFNLTRADVQTAWSLPASYWNNFAKESCTTAGGYCVGNTGSGINLIIDLTNKQFKLSNSLGANPNAENIKLYAKDRTNEILVDSSNTAIRPFSVALDNMYEIYKKTIANPLNEVKETAPTDTTKIWYKPNGQGGYDMYKYQNGAWTKVGIADTAGKSEIFVATLAELQAIPCSLGSRGYVGDGATSAQYVCGLNGVWETLASSSSGGGTFNGTGTIVAMATTLFTKAGGSIADSQAPSAEWGGSKTFTKKDDTTTGGYWKTDDNAYVVTNTIDSLNKLSYLFTTGTTAWIAKGTTDVYKLQKKTLPNAAVAWAYITKDYGTLLSFDTAASSNGDGVYIYVTDRNEFFYYSNGVFTPHPSGTGKTYASKSTSGRDIFSPINGNTYLIQSNDCTDLTCNGTAGASYYAGSQIDGLYAYYYSTTGKYKNYLTDATPYTSWATFWSDAASAVQWNGATFGEVPTGAILTKNTLNGAIVYSYNSNYVNKSNGFIIPQNKLPSGLVASTATITQNSGKNYVNVTSLDTFVIDTNLAVGYTVNLTGSGFTNKLIERCLNLSDGSQWSDNCLNIAGSTVAISDQSRSDLTAPGSSSRINLTKQTGTEPNYTTTGVTYTADAGYKQWFYSASGTITNAMLDAIIPTAKYATSNQGTGVAGYTTASINAYLDTTAKTVGYAYLNGIVAQYSNPYWKPIADSTKILSGDFQTQIIATDIGGVASNGLIYTGTSSPFNSTYTIDSQFGVTTWSVASPTSINDRWNAGNICRTRGMLLPRLGETTGSTNPWGGTTYVSPGDSMGSASGVPSHPSGYTWTAASWTNSTNNYWLWSGTGTDGSNYYNGYYVRCVR